ncbi:MAG TPA: FAD-binding oxidoreductase [Aliidongia sp.]|uniref:NAD(P)/FAD-dependent oxidoreductase n=1 Tax=Aliidongia sp. TaxID=1914230 RepID=UPI002DDD3744|nr:FAD-binding oxidoreductase [Aliidongia sp.]HEV2675135.1 FAD-binding oxidoreductase [Aliidongia sp.]
MDVQDVKLTPYWWDQVPRPEVPVAPLPSRVDVVVIGSGYTGLSAALQTARGGRDTLVIDAGDVGWGCSTRNGGQISTSIKPGFDALARRHGRERAAAIIQEGRNSLAWVAAFVEAEKIDCDFRIVGRFHAAHSPGKYEALARQLDAQPTVEAHLVPRSEQRGELGTDAYFGGVVYARHASIDPAKYHRGMLERAVAAGVRVVAHCPATDIRRESGGFLVQTARGPIAARQVVVATNGYTGRLTPWLQRRVIPIGSYIIATEPLAPGVMARLMPKGRIVSDTRKVVYYYRPSPDNTRILFGGRVSIGETDPRVSGPLLHAAMTEVFPELSTTRISHSWYGFVAYTFDELMHIGERDGLHYAMGYCGSGVGMAGYLGMRLGRQVLGLADGATGLDGVEFQTRPFYRGNPWFLAPSVMYYRWRDKLAR